MSELSRRSERKHDEHGHAVEDLYGSIGGPLYAVHFNGYPYAAFSGPSQAIDFWRGLDTRGRVCFHIENAAGEHVRLEQNRHGHAHAIIEALDA